MCAYFKCSGASWVQDSSSKDVDPTGHLSLNNGPWGEPPLIQFLGDEQIFLAQV
jgi:hypothetical protein